MAQLTNETLDELNESEKQQILDLEESILSLEEEVEKSGRKFELGTLTEAEKVRLENTSNSIQLLMFGAAQRAGEKSTQLSNEINQAEQNIVTLLQEAANLQHPSATAVVTAQATGAPATPATGAGSQTGGTGGASSTPLTPEQQLQKDRNDTHARMQALITDMKNYDQRYRDKITALQNKLESVKTADAQALAALKKELDEIDKDLKAHKKALQEVKDRNKPSVGEFGEKFANSFWDAIVPEAFKDSDSAIASTFNYGAQFLWEGGKTVLGTVFDVAKGAVEGSFGQEGKLAVMGVGGLVTAFIAAKATGGIIDKIPILNWPGIRHIAKLAIFGFSFLAGMSGSEWALNQTRYWSQSSGDKKTSGHVPTRMSDKYTDNAPPAGSIPRPEDTSSSQSSDGKKTGKVFVDRTLDDIRQARMTAPTDSNGQDIGHAVSGIRNANYVPTSMVSSTTLISREHNNNFVPSNMPHADNSNNGIARVHHVDGNVHYTTFPRSSGRAVPTPDYDEDYEARPTQDIA